MSGLVIFYGICCTLAVLAMGLIVDEVIRHDVRIWRQTQAAKRHLEGLRAAGLSEEELRIEEIAFWRTLDPA